MMSVPNIQCSLHPRFLCTKQHSRIAIRSFHLPPLPPSPRRQQCEREKEEEGGGGGGAQVSKLARAMTHLLNPPLIPCWRCPRRHDIHIPAAVRPVPQSQRRGLSGLVQPGKAVVGRSVRCMANPRRVKMVAKQIRRELSDMLLTDKVLQFAVLPEASLGADRYLSSLTTITDVEVSADLQVVKVYVSVFGDDRGKEVAIAGLKSKAKYVRSELGRRMKLRLTPEIRFIEDESFERGSRVIAILDKIKNEKNLENQNKEQLDSSAHQDDDDWDGEDPDEGIIYVE